jgi:hypothetical protein
MSQQVDQYFQFPWYFHLSRRNLQPGTSSLLGVASSTMVLWKKLVRFFPM